MHCHYFAEGRCGSCTELPVALTPQRERKAAQVRALLPATTWLPTWGGPDQAFRNKAKVVVGGTTEAPALGILTPDGVQDLRECPLYEASITQALPVLAGFITRAELTPYDVVTRRGELKYLLVTCSPAGDLMVRFVARSREPETRLAKHLAWLTAQLPGLRVATLNVQPFHAAVLEGDWERVLTPQDALGMRLPGTEILQFWLGPQSFFQTNSAGAAAMLAQAGEWLGKARTVWDLYCGVGTFGLVLAQAARARDQRPTPPAQVLGVELSAAAVGCAVRSAAEAGLDAEFVAADAGEWFRARLHDVQSRPDLLVVNPPRRGIGDLADLINRSDVETVLYSSCNPESLATDLAGMDAYRVDQARVFDLFPHTRHAEVMVLLRRR